MFSRQTSDVPLHIFSLLYHFISTLLQQVSVKNDVKILLKPGPLVIYVHNIEMYFIKIISKKKIPGKFGL